MYERNGERGITLLELSMVLVVIGIIMGIAIFSWMSFIEAKKVSETYSDLTSVKNCLFSKMLYSTKYPTYSDPLTAQMCANHSYSSEKEVDLCICGGRKDAWGHYIRYIDGFDASNSSLAGKDALKRPWAGITYAYSPSPESQIIDKDGKVVTKVAFVLVSFGKDGRADDPSYANMFVGDNLVGDLRVSTPCFNCTSPAHRDDLYLVVTGDEIRAFLSRR